MTHYKVGVASKILADVDSVPTSLSQRLATMAQASLRFVRLQMSYILCIGFSRRECVIHTLKTY